MKQQICILDLTGSIGTQALDVISQHPDLHEAYALTANHRWKELAGRARRFNPAAVVIANEAYYEPLKQELADIPDVEVYAGNKALEDIVELPSIDMVFTAMVDYSGLALTIHAIRAKKKMYLANKETLVVAGELILQLAQQYHVPILPVDSKHSAIFQSLVGEDANEIEKTLLTCSGGPFRTFTHEQLKHVTAADALKHPTWGMGVGITIDSVSLMNKGFEVIEAKRLFGVPADKIQMLVHPQSIVHSAVQFCDGGVKAQLGIPDIRLPIQYAFSFPQCLPLRGNRLGFFRQPLEFFKPDVEKFKCLAMAYEAINKGGNMPCIVNATNEIVSEGFRRGAYSLLAVGDIIEKAMQTVAFDNDPDYDVYVQTDAEVRRVALEIMNNR